METLNIDLRNLRCEGNTAYLPTEQLQDYNLLKKTLTKACGKYNKNKFEFPYPAQAIINRLLSGENIDFKKEFQFFATPEGLAKRLIDYVIFDKDVINVLEPSAGHGALIDALLDTNGVIQKNIDAVELSKLNFEVLKDKYKSVDDVNLIQDDFLEFKTDKKYDLIIANPPFSKNQDIDHILKMYEHLDKGGRLITISSKSWTFGTQKKQKAFREWVDEEGTLIDLEHGAFKSSGTNVSGCLIIIDK